MEKGVDEQTPGIGRGYVTEENESRVVVVVGKEGCNR